VGRGEVEIFDLLPTLSNAPSKKKIRDTILFYTKTSEYLQSTTKYQYRVDLNGKFVGEIMKEQHNFALQSLKNRNFKRTSRVDFAFKKVRANQKRIEKI
jgi:sRNA-binding protein